MFNLSAMTSFEVRRRSFHPANMFSRITFIRSKININRVCKLIATGCRRRVQSQRKEGDGGGGGGMGMENIDIDIRNAEISVNIGGLW